MGVSHFATPPYLGPPPEANLQAIDCPCCTPQREIGLSLLGSLGIQHPEVDFQSYPTTTSDLSISSTTPWDPNQEPKK